MKNFKVPFGPKIIISLVVFSFVFSFNFALADTCDELRPVLDKYYQASQEENIDAYMAVMDKDYLRENLLDNYEDYVKSAWEVYDTKEYKIENYNCKMEKDDALMYFNLSTTLLSEGQEISTQRNYVALFSNVDGWKIRYVMDEDVFSQFQNSLYSQLFLDATKEEITKTVDDAEVVAEYAKTEEALLASDFENTISDAVPDRKIAQKQNNESGGSLLKYILFIIALLAVIAIFLNNKFKFFKKKS